MDTKCDHNIIRINNTVRSKVEYRCTNCGQHYHPVDMAYTLYDRYESQKALVNRLKKEIDSLIDKKEKSKDSVTVDGTEFVLLGNNQDHV